MQISPTVEAASVYNKRWVEVASFGSPTTPLH